MFASSQMMPLFAVPVWAQVLEDAKAQSLNAGLLAEAVKLKAALPPETDFSQGWQTRNDLHLLDAFADLSEVIVASTERVLETLKVAPGPFEITGCWLNFKPGGADHPLHTHPNNYLSGVYYVQAPTGADSIVFHDSRKEHRVIVPRYTEETQFTATSVNVPIRAGVLIMFPSWVEHSVRPNPTNEMRVSAAFNIMFSDFTETQSVPNWDWAEAEAKDRAGG